MRKIMLSDKFGLTKAVLEGRKTMTRRVVNFDRVPTLIPGRIAECCLKYAPFKVGEVVAVAQSYKDAGILYDEHTDEKLEGCAGWTNKMFVASHNMPHQIRITNIRVERLQDITRGDIEKEGIQWSHKAHRYYTCFNPITATYLWLKGTTPEEAFAALIDKVSGKGVWDSNPFVFVYEFELVK